MFSSKIGEVEDLPPCLGRVRDIPFTDQSDCNMCSSHVISIYYVLRMRVEKKHTIVTGF